MNIQNISNENLKHIYWTNENIYIQMHMHICINTNNIHIRTLPHNISYSIKDICDETMERY